MREIKFRGKRVDNDEWVYGDLLHGQGSKDGNVYILPLTQFYPKDCDDLDGYNIDPETVGQLTPVKTPDGKDIYEGDIVEHSNDIPYGVYDDGLVGEVKMLEAQWVIDTGKELIPLWSEATHRTVLGNIFENPELLK